MFVLTESAGKMMAAFKLQTSSAPPDYATNLALTTKLLVECTGPQLVSIWEPA